MSLIKFSTSNENISSNGGFSFISGILDSLLPMNRWDSDLPCYHNVQFSHQTIVRSVIAMMAAGCCNFADVEKLGCDSMFQQLVGEDIPSQESLRQRLNMLANRPWRPIVDASAAAILRKAVFWFLLKRNFGRIFFRNFAGGSAPRPPEFFKASHSPV